MKSMTGYGHAREAAKLSSIEVSLRAVNGRFLEPRLHLPREFHAFEQEVRKILGKYFSRGTVDLYVTRRMKPVAKKTSIKVNGDIAKTYFRSLLTLQKELKLNQPIHIEGLIRLPEVIQVDEAVEVDASEKKALLKAVTAACELCEKERLREGRALRLEMVGHVETLLDLVEQIAQLREEANRGLLEKFHQKLKSRAPALEVDPQRLSQEIVLQLEKSDIDEEVVRLREHMKNYTQLLSSDGAVGKKLDFYTQELLREVNTIGSKSSLSRLTQIVVEAKTGIEKLREQVQNIE